MHTNTLQVLVIHKLVWGCTISQCHFVDRLTEMCVFLSLRMLAEPVVLVDWSLVTLP